jgi:hypothetical protein
MAVIITQAHNVTESSYTYNRNYVYLISAIATLGGVLFGFDLDLLVGKYFELK